VTKRRSDQLNLLELSLEAAFELLDESLDIFAPELEAELLDDELLEF